MPPVATCVTLTVTYPLQAMVSFSIRQEGWAKGSAPGICELLKEYFNNCILLQLVSFVILGFFCAFKNIPVRRGPEVPPDCCQRGHETNRNPGLHDPVSLPAPNLMIPLILCVAGNRLSLSFHVFNMAGVITAPPASQASVRLN